MADLDTSGRPQETISTSTVERGELGQEVVAGQKKRTLNGIGASLKAAGKAALVIAPVLAGASEAIAQTETPIYRAETLEQDFATRLKIMKEQGWIIADAGGGSAITLSNNDGTYRIIGRFEAHQFDSDGQPLWGKPIKGKHLVMETEGCNVYQYSKRKNKKREKKGKQTFAPAMVCDYTVKLGDEFVEQTARNQMPATQYFAAINEHNNDWGSGGPSLTSPVQPGTAGESTRAMLEARAAVWKVCFNPIVQGADKKTINAFDFDSKLSSTKEKAICQKAKYATSEHVRTARLNRTKRKTAETEKRTAETEKRTAETQKRTAETQKRTAETEESIKRTKKAIKAMDAVLDILKKKG